MLISHSRGNREKPQVKSSLVDEADSIGRQAGSRAAKSHGCDEPFGAGPKARNRQRGRRWKTVRFLTSTKFCGAVALVTGETAKPKEGSWWRLVKVVMALERPAVKGRPVVSHCPPSDPEKYQASRTSSNPTCLARPAS